MFDLVKDQMAYGEADPAELPDNMDDLLHLRFWMVEVSQAIRALRQSCDEKIGTVLAQGEKYEYGDSIISYRHGYKWKPIPDSVKALVETFHEPEDVLALFPVGSIRKTGLEKVAARHGMDPAVAVASVLEKVWDKAPSVAVKPKEL